MTLPAPSAFAWGHMSVSTQYIQQTSKFNAPTVPSSYVSTMHQINSCASSNPYCAAKCFVLSFKEPEKSCRFINFFSVPARNRAKLGFLSTTPEYSVNQLHRASKHCGENGTILLFSLRRFAFANTLCRSCDQGINYQPRYTVFLLSRGLRPRPSMETMSG
jgi:hypothetical protein